MVTAPLTTEQRAKAIVQKVYAKPFATLPRAMPVYARRLRGVVDPDTSSAWLPTPLSSDTD